MPEKEPQHKETPKTKHPLLTLSKKIGGAVILTMKNPAEIKDLVKEEIRRFRRLMRHKFYY